MSDLIRITEYLSKRCFDKILLYFDMESSENWESLVFYHVDFLKQAFLDNIEDSIGIYVLNSTVVSDELTSAIVKYEPKVKVFKLG